MLIRPDPHDAVEDMSRMLARVFAPLEWNNSVERTHIDYFFDDPPWPAVSVDEGNYFVTPQARAEGEPPDSQLRWQVIYVTETHYTFETPPESVESIVADNLSPDAAVVALMAHMLRYYRPPTEEDDDA